MAKIARINRCELPENYVLEAELEENQVNVRRSQLEQDNYEKALPSFWMMIK